MHTRSLRLIKPAEVKPYLNNLITLTGRSGYAEPHVMFAFARRLGLTHPPTQRAATKQGVWLFFE